MEPVFVQALGGDSFKFGDELYTLDELILLLQVGRANNIEKQLEGSLSEMATINKEMTEANEILEKLRVDKGALKDEDDKSSLSGSIKDYLDANDIGYPSGNLNKEQYDVVIENVKANVDQLNQLSQLTVLKLSSALKARDEGYALASATIKDSSDARKEVIRAI